MNKLFRLYDLSKKQERRVVVRSNVKPADAMGYSAVPPVNRWIHRALRPSLEMIDLLHWDYEGGISQGQMVTHEVIAEEVRELFLEMFRLKFPIFSVIPQSVFGYNDEASMQLNNSSCYRPEQGSEHGVALAVDINTNDNPFVRRKDGEMLVNPVGATYDPGAKGALVGGGPVVEAWRSRDINWGGYWSNRAKREYVRPELNDYQHFELSKERRDALYNDLPPVLRDF